MAGGTSTTPPSEIMTAAKTLALSTEIGNPGFEELTGETGIFANSSGAAPAGNIAINVNTLRANVNPDGTPIEHGYAFVGSSSRSQAGTAGPTGTVTVSGPDSEPTDAATSVILNNFAINNSVDGGTASTPAATATITRQTSWRSTVESSPINVAFEQGFSRPQKAAHLPETLPSTSARSPPTIPFFPAAAPALTDGGTSGQRGASRARRRRHAPGRRGAPSQYRHDRSPRRRRRIDRHVGRLRTHAERVHRVRRGGGGQTTERQYCPLGR